MKIIAGLGNPGLEYTNNRHNVGYIIVDAIARNHNINFVKKLDNQVAKISSEEKQYIIAKSNNYMNSSGLTIIPLLSFFKIDPSNLIVIHDDLDLPLGKVKAQINGYYGGHNGLLSINQFSQHTNYTRVRVGIGRPDRKEKVPSYVLSNFSQEEMKVLNPLIEEIYIHLKHVLNGDLSCFNSFFK